MTIRPGRRAVLGLASLMFLGLGQGARAGDGAKLAAGDRARLEEAFGATIVSTYPDGRQAELWLKRDGAYLSEGRRHDRSSGTWQIKDDKLCLRQHAPFPAPFSFCTAVPSGSLDKPWQSKAFTGETITVRLVKGMHTGGGGDLKQAGASAQSATRGTE